MDEWQKQMNNEGERWKSTQAKIKAESNLGKPCNPSGHPLHPGVVTDSVSADAFSRTMDSMKKLADQKLNHDPVNHPSHYTSHPSGVECITITRHMNFNLGNAIKYIWRDGLKQNSIQDLEKAIFYLKDEIERLKNQPQKTYGA